MPSRLDALECVGLSMSELYHAYMETTPANIALEWSGRDLTVTIRNGNDTYVVEATRDGPASQFMMRVVKGDPFIVGQWFQQNLPAFCPMHQSPAMH